MSEPKVQLLDPQGNINLPGINATGVITASSLDGAGGVVTGLTGNPNLNVGVVTATSFVGDGTGHAANLTGTPNLNLGLTTATSFVGDATGKAAGLTGTPNLNVGLITASSFGGDVTGDITGNITGNVTGNITGDVTGNVTGIAGSVVQGTNIHIGVMTATSYYGDGSNLTGIAATNFNTQTVTANSASTSIDLSAGNVITFNQSSNTTVSFANTSEAMDITLIRIKDSNATARTITWPDSVNWDGGTAPTLITNPAAQTGTVQQFQLITRDSGVTWYGWEDMQKDSGYGIFTWGLNSSGQLGLNDRDRRSSPTQVGMKSWSQVTTALSYTMGLKTDGTLWSWGVNEFGTLGLGGVNASSPTQVGSSSNWNEIFAGYYSVFGKQTDGSLWSWGLNNNGQLGHNNKTNQDTPLQVGTDTTWKETRGGYLFTIGLKTNGTLWSWGSNNDQLGQGDNTNRSSPTQIGTDTTWTNVGAGMYQGYSVKTDGTLWAWGKGASYSLGNNSQSNINSPIQVPGSNWSQSSGAVAGYRKGGFAINTSGNLYGWGVQAGDHAGILGQNNNTTYTTPQQIPGTTWSIISASYQGTALALKTDNTLWAMGRGSYGGTGQNDDIPRSSPTQIPGTWQSINKTASNFRHGAAIKAF